MIVKEITRETLDPERYSSHCTDCGMAPKMGDDVDYLTGWWKRHVLETGHRVVIEERE